MICMAGLRRYWTGMAERICGIDSVMGLTVDASMATAVSQLQLGSVTLFWFPPAAMSKSRDADSFGENNDIVVFVMEKYDTQRSSAIDILEHTQGVIERLKEALLEDQRCGCAVMRVDVSTLNTLPETKFVAGFAGWSIGFKTVT